MKVGGDAAVLPHHEAGPAHVRRRHQDHRRQGAIGDLGRREGLVGGRRGGSFGLGPLGAATSRHTREREDSLHELASASVEKTWPPWRKIAGTSPPARVK